MDDFPHTHNDLSLLHTQRLTSSLRFRIEQQNGPNVSSSGFHGADTTMNFSQ